MSETRQKLRSFIQLLSSYIILYWLLGSLFFLIVFGFNESLAILISSPFKKNLSNGFLIFLSSFLASVIIFLWKKRVNPSFTLTAFQYGLTGFYVGNLSLLLMFFLDPFFRSYIIWEFPDFLLIYLSPFLALLLSYLAGFAFLSIIPSCMAALIIYIVLRWKGRRIKADENC